MNRQLRGRQALKHRRVTLTALFALLVLTSSILVDGSSAASPPTAPIPPFSPAPLNLSKDQGHAFAPTVAASGNNVYAAWADETPNLATLRPQTGDWTHERCPINPTNNTLKYYPGVYDIMIAVSADGGTGFSAPIDLTNRAVLGTPPDYPGFLPSIPLGSLYCRSPRVNDPSPHIRIAISGNNVYVAWGENEFTFGDDLGTGPPAGVFFSYSANGGATFSPAIDLAGTPQGNTPTDIWANYNTPGNLAGRAYAPEIAASGNNVYVVWEDIGSGTNVYYERSTDGGRTFNGGTPAAPVGAPINLSSDNNSFVPKVGASGTSVYVVWRDNAISTGDIALRKSVDGGATFLSLVNISHDGKASDPQLAVTPAGGALVAWSDVSKDATVSLGDVFVGGSDGVSPGLIIDMTDFHGSSQPAIGAAWDPQLVAASPGVFYLAWLDTSPGFRGLYVGVIAGGHSSVRITDSNDTPSNPRVAAIGNTQFVSWTDGGNQIEFQSGTSSGSLINSPCCDGVTISDTGPTNDGREQVAMAASGKEVNVVWHDHTLSNGQVYSRQDTLIPSPPKITSPADGAVVGTATPAIAGTSDPPLSVQVFDGSNLVGTTTPDPTTGQWSVVTSPLTNGPHTITAVAKTSAGISQPSNAISITVSAPTSTVSSSLSSSSSSASSSSSSTTSSSNSSSSSTSGGGGGGIPEFPYQVLGATLFTILFASAYLLARGRMGRLPRR